jgi:hypothetical protein
MPKESDLDSFLKWAFQTGLGILYVKVAVPVGIAQTAAGVLWGAMTWASNRSSQNEAELRSGKWHIDISYCGTVPSFASRSDKDKVLFFDSERLARDAYSRMISQNDGNWRFALNAPTED